jgi:hypothetical protein
VSDPVGESGVDLSQGDGEIPAMVRAAMAHLNLVMVQVSSTSPAARASIASSAWSMSGGSGSQLP